MKESKARHSCGRARKTQRSACEVWGGANLVKKQVKGIVDKGTTCSKDLVVRETKRRSGRGESREQVWGEWDDVVGRVSKTILRITRLL